MTNIKAAFYHGLRGNRQLITTIDSRLTLDLLNHSIMALLNIKPEHIIKLPIEETDTKLAGYVNDYLASKCQKVISDIIIDNPIDDIPYNNLVRLQIKYILTETEQDNALVDFFVCFLNELEEMNVHKDMSSLVLDFMPTINNVNHYRTSNMEIGKYVSKVRHAITSISDIFKHTINKNITLISHVTDSRLYDIWTQNVIMHSIEMITTGKSSLYVPASPETLSSHPNIMQCSRDNNYSGVMGLVVQHLAKESLIVAKLVICQLRYIISDNVTDRMKVLEEMVDIHIHVLGYLYESTSRELIYKTMNVYYSNIIVLSTREPTLKRLLDVADAKWVK